MMKTILISVGLLLSISAFAHDVHVNGYTKQDGTYVNSYNRTAPNDTRNDNYSTRGNVNPYNGNVGTKPRDEERPTQNSYGIKRQNNGQSGYGYKNPYSNSDNE